MLQHIDDALDREAQDAAVKPCSRLCWNGGILGGCERRFAADLMLMLGVVDCRGDQSSRVNMWDAGRVQHVAGIYCWMSNDHRGC